jgi:AcrR family transcriptional regulator
MGHVDTEIEGATVKMPAKKQVAKKPVAPSPREVLLEAGLELLAGGLSGAQLEPRLIARQAGLRTPQFTKVFPDFADYLAAILRRLSEQVRNETLMAIGRKPPGRELIRKGITAYLNAILKRPAMPELTLLMRAHPACQEVTRERMSSMVMLATLQLKMAGIPNFDGLGRLGMAMLFEIAHAEYEARRALPDYRQTLDAYFVAR